MKAGEELTICYTSLLQVTLPTNICYAIILCSWQSLHFDCGYFFLGCWNMDDDLYNDNLFGKLTTINQKLLMESFHSSKKWGMVRVILRAILNSLSNAKVAMIFFPADSHSPGHVQADKTFQMCLSKVCLITFSSVSNWMSYKVSRPHWTWKLCCKYKMHWVWGGRRAGDEHINN